MHDAVKRLAPYLVLIACAVALCLLCPARASAATQCAVNATTLTFSAFDVYGSAVTGSGTISGSCHNAAGNTQVPMTITLGNGSNYQSGTGYRGMTCSTCTGFTTDVLQYQLYTDAALTNAWIGATALSFNACPANCTGSTPTNWSVSVYGQIFAAVAGGMNDVAAPAGNSYSDSVVVTANF